MPDENDRLTPAERAADAARESREREAGLDYETMRAARETAREQHRDNPGKGR